MELCLSSFRRDHKTEMARKKIVVALFLPETSLPMEIVFQINEAVGRGRHRTIWTEQPVPELLSQLA